MPASPAWRRLSAVVPLAVAGFVGAALLLAPAAQAAAPSAAAGFGARQLAQPNRESVIQERENEAANIAVSHIGDPYRYGAAGPHQFDCSGLSMWSYDHAHLSLPRSAAEQYASVRHLIKDHMVRGDLVFFHDASGHIYHVGMFLYWNPRHIAVIIHAPHTGQRVHRQAVWTSAWFAGTRRP